MIGEYGETLVIDWGLAKLINEEQLASSQTREVESLALSSKSNSSETAVGSAVGTPAFMSPEQTRGIHTQVGPASDVYSLGATLYCILTGKTAFASSAKILKQILAGDFLPPIALLGSVPRPLNAICLRAMATVPAERYSSARQFAEELERWLNDEPVLAYQETKFERWQRWKRRNRAWVRAGQSLLLTSLMVFAIATLVISQAKERERLAKENEMVAKEEAIRHKQNAILRFEYARQAIDTWLSDGATALEYTDADPQVRRALLERAANDYQSLVADTSTDPQLELVRGQTALRLGNLYLQMGNLDSALDIYQQAKQLFQTLSGNSEVIAQTARLEQANVEHGLGLVAAGHQALEQSLKHYDTADMLIQGVEELPAINDYIKLSRLTLLVSRLDALFQLRRLDECQELMKTSLPATLSAESVWALPYQQSRQSFLRLVGAISLERGDHEIAVATLEKLVQQLSMNAESASRDVSLADSWVFWQSRTVVRRIELKPLNLIGPPSMGSVTSNTHFAVTYCLVKSVP